MRRTILALLAGLFLVANTLSATNVSGSITTNTTWTLANSPYIVTGDVNLGSPSSPRPVLTIEPGVTVKFNAGRTIQIGYSSSPTNHGELQAIGTAGQPITFTANTGSPTAGYWQGIQFYGSGATNSQLSYVTVSYGGGNFGGIRITESSPAIQSTTVQNCAHSGISIEGSSTPTITGSTLTANPYGMWVYSPASPNLQNVTLSNNTNYALILDIKVTLGSVSGLVATGNGTNGIYLRSYGIYLDASATWKNVGLPYVITNDVWIGSTTTPRPVLTIEPGVNVKVTAGKTVLVGYSSSPTNHGELQAVGTAAQPITFTANSGSPTAGYWQGIQFYGSGASNSQLSYVTVSYGGGNFGGVRITESSPAIQNTTVQNCAHSGISIEGGSTPTITGSTLTANPIGLYLTAPATVNLQTVSITGNTGYAINIDIKVTLGTVTGLTATGNGTNAIYVRSYGIYLDASATWKNVGLPYVISNDVWLGSATTPRPVLTIEPGVTVKFNAGRFFLVGYASSNHGELQAVGTAAQPITFTANTASPTAGYWLGIQFYGSGASNSLMSYATVSYGGQSGNYGGIRITDSSPTVRNATLQTNAYAGISTEGISAPTVTDCSFTGNTAGFINRTPTNIVNARLSYWNSATGPSGSGSGSGQSVSTGVKFEPWLSASPSQPHYFTAATHLNRTFNPAIGVNTTIGATTTDSGSWTVTVTNASSTVVRTVTGTSASPNLAWDGKNDSGADQPDGTYTYELTSTATGGSTAPARGNTLLDRTKQLAPTNLAVSYAFFSPNADAVQDTTTLTGSNSFDNTTWTVNVRNASSALVRTAAAGTGTNLSYPWDGKNDAAVVQPDGLYTLEAALTNGTATASVSITTTLDVTLPTASISAPSDGQVLSNVYVSGLSDVDVYGSTDDTNFNNWSLQSGVGTSPASWTTLASGTAPVSAVKLKTWATLLLTNSLYTLRLQGWDKAGNRGLSEIRPTVGNFRVSHNALQFNPSTGATVVYTSIVPFQVTETLTLKDAAGQVARTLVNTSRSAGTYPDSWNGRNDASAIVPDGPYSYFATVTDGQHTYTWDLSTQYLNDYAAYNDWLNIAAYNPFNNQPLTFTYNFQDPGRVSIGLTPNATGQVPNNCNPPNFCLANSRYEEGGPHTVTWAGVDSTGAYRSDIKKIGVVTQRYAFAKNAVIAFGSKPAVTNVTVTPPVYGPAVSTQTVAFTLATTQSQTANVTVTFRNQASLSILRTIALSAQAAGQRTTTWDGRADNGAWVAPGRYTVTVTATDTLGNQAIGQILTTVQY